MMLLLLVVLWLLEVLARDDPHRDSQHLLIQVQSCPAVGYFFHREPSSNTLESACFLCFCQGDGTAVCWQRENRKCDAAHYQHGVAKIESRVRRSPIGLSDIFFRDAARDLFDKQTPETCKPYETSFSEGCPPADWCVGCTVCDCDANGRWDCHILSFCPDKKDKTKLKTIKKRVRNASGHPKRTTITTTPKPTIGMKPKRTPAPKKTAINTNKQVKKNPKEIARVNKATNNKNVKKINNVKPKSNNKAKIMQRKANTTHKPLNSKQRSDKAPPKPLNITQRRGNASPKPLIIKKGIQKIEPINIKFSEMEHIMNNETEKITRLVYNQVYKAMQKFLDKRISAIQPPTKQSVKTAQKRTMVKRSAKNIQNTKNAKTKVNGQFRPVATKKKYSKAVGPKNNKQKKISNMKKPVQKGTTKKPHKYTNGKRIKREVSDYNITETVVIENSSYTNMETPVKIPHNSIFNSAINETMSNATETSGYYKYSMITPMLPKVTASPAEYQIVFALSTNKSEDMNTTHTNIKREEKPTFEVKAIKLNSTSPDLKNNSLLGKQPIHVDKADPEFNELKFYDWPQIKLFKKSLAIKRLVNINFKNATNITIVTTTKPNRIKIKDVGRVLDPYIKKYNRSRIIQLMSCNTQNSPKRNTGNLRDQIYSKIQNLQNVLKSVLSEFHNNSTAKIKLAPRRFNVMKYMKKFFGKYFRGYKSKDKNNMRNKINLNDQIIDSICEGFKECDKSKKNSLILRYKLRELNTESNTIIRTIKIIKGLLHLLDIPPNTTKLLDDPYVKSNTAKSSLKKDIHKLNAVLKDKYTTSNNTLTSTQMTQITYIKNNTQLFVQSVGKFANILNEIITILTTNQNIGDKRAFKTVKRGYENNPTPKNDTDFKRLKELLVQYNFIQNTFIRKMYDLVTKLETHENNMKVLESKENSVKTATIGRFSRNIVNNLRNLKNFAQRLNTKRPKRNTFRDDDAMEYLLTLMEFLLKQNYPLDAAPVNDGIDLLLEAIQNAPDIKPIKKKVLQTLPSKIRISRTTEPVPSSVLEDSHSDSGRVGEDSSDNDTRSDTEEQGSYQEKKGIVKYYPGNNIFETTDAVKTEVYYETPESLNTSSQVDTTVIPGASGIFANIEETTEHNNFKKFENLESDNRKKFELFNSDIDDEEVEIVTSSTKTTMPAELESETDTTVTTTIQSETTEFELAKIKAKQNNMNSRDISGNSGGEPRVSLDWLDEGYEDSKEVGETKNETTRVTRTEAPVITTTEAVVVDNASSITRETKDDGDRKRKAKINIEEVMYKKQMDLLNSLDYVTEKSEGDDVESKEGDERDSGDAFPAYFV